MVYYVYEEMKKHVGRENAISGEDLSRLFGITTRHLRYIINEIRNSGELEKVIGSCNAGYFICTKEEQSRANLRIYRQAFRLLKRRARTTKSGKERARQNKTRGIFQRVLPSRSERPTRNKVRFKKARQAVSDRANFETA